MLASENRKSLLFGVPGIGLQVVGMVVVQSARTFQTLLLARLAMLAGVALLVVGLVHYAKAKGHHPAWGLVGLLSCVGLIILACLPDRAPGGAVPAAPPVQPPLPSARPVPPAPPDPPAPPPGQD